MNLKKQNIHSAKKKKIEHAHVTLMAKTEGSKKGDEASQDLFVYFTSR